MALPRPPSPQRIGAECVCLNLRRAARALSRRYDDALVSVDLNNGQFSVLASIAGLQPVSMQALADHLAMDRTTATAALKPLQRRGLLEVAVSKVDPRAREVTLTPAGTALFARAGKLWRWAQNDTARRLGAMRSAALLDHLSRLT